MYPNSDAGCPWDECDIPKSPWDVDVFSDEKKVVGMMFGPHQGGQSLYYINHFPGGKSGEAIFRVSFVSEANRDPRARISADRTVGFVPFTVQFDGTESYDPDAEDSLGYEWDFDGDGTVDSTDARPQYTYMTAGSFEATLRVSDGRGGKSSRTFIRIDVDNSPPIATIESIAPGTTFAVGDVFTLTGSAWDAEDGVLPESALTWEVRQHHNNHYHPFLDPTVGNNIVISEAPPPEDFYVLTTTTSYLSIRLTATDSQGLSATTVVDVQPRLVNLVFDTQPSGISLLINQDKYETPVSLIGWEGDAFEIEAATRLSRDGAQKWEFVSWSDGSTDNARPFVVPSESDPDPIIATFVEEVPEEATYDSEAFGSDGDKNDAPKTNNKFVVALLDMSVSVRFSDEFARRRRLGVLAAEANPDLVSLLEEELKDAMSNAVSSAVAAAITSLGSKYAPLHGIRFAQKGEKALVDDKGLMWTSIYGGLAIFDREDDVQLVPNEFALQSAQINALAAVEDDLISDLREYVAEAGAIKLGYQHVRSVSAEVIDKASVAPSSTMHSFGDEKDPVLTGLLVLAILLILLIAASGIAFFIHRRSQKESSSKVCMNSMSNDMESNMGEKMKSKGEANRSSGSETDDETPANSPTKASALHDPSDPHGCSGSRERYGYGDNEDDASVTSSVANSVASSIQSIARDMMSQLNSVLGPEERVVIQPDQEEEDADASLAPALGPGSRVPVE